LALGVLAADCAPVLFADAEARVVGAAHAGWKGALAGITDATVAAMEALGARRARIVAQVGPCIAQSSYEVGPELRQAFLDAAPENADFFAQGARTDRWQFDLPGYVVGRLAAARIGAAGALGRDTYADAARFYSFRRTTHRGEGDYGRLLSAIALPT
jgi:YfiH family protein